MSAFVSSDQPTNPYLQLFAQQEVLNLSNKNLDSIQAGLIAEALVDEHCVLRTLNLSSKAPFSPKY